MTRTRIKPMRALDLDAQLTPSARPPAEILPDDLNHLFAEYDSLMLTKRNADHEVRELATGALDRAAEKEDGAARIAAIRAGQAAGGNPAQESLRERRAQAERNRAAATEALRVVSQEIATARNTAWERGERKYRTAEQKAREQVAKALSGLEAAMANLGTQIGLREWLSESAPFDPSTAITIRDLHGDNNAANPAATVTAPHIINVLTNI